MKLGFATYGGYEGVGAASNILFTNGDLDPWGAWGVNCEIHACGKDVVSILIKGGAHHLDLMFANEADPPSVIAARSEARKTIARWIVRRKEAAAATEEVEITVM